MPPILSIVIATKNRVKYCIAAIEHILSFNEHDFELIIQDNTDNLSLKEHVENNFSDYRLKYNYTPPPFSSIDNFNMAISLASGRYLCLIGDDDGVCTSLFQIVKWANENNIDSISPAKFVSYVWPNKETNGKMTIPYFSTRIWYNSPLEYIQPLVNNGIIQYLDFNLPKLYHGVVKRELLEKVKSIAGNYVGGLSPDIYSSISLSLVTNSNLVIDFPLTIAGACDQSTTYDNSKGKHSGKLEDAPHLRSRENYVWDNNVPAFYSVPTIWAESGIKAIKECNIEADIKKLNLIKILAAAINDSPAFASFFMQKTIEKLERQELFSFKRKVFAYRLILYIKKVWKKLANRIPRKYIFKLHRITGICDIKKAAEIADRILREYELEQKLNHHKK